MKQFLKLFAAGFAAAMTMRILLNMWSQKNPIFEPSDAAFPIILGVVLAYFIPRYSKSRMK